MADPYIGEIRMWGGTYAPAGWAFCNGQALPISEYEALFNLIGTTYGGDGQTTFDLPNIQGRLPLHVGAGFQMGQQAGEETVTLTSNQLPIHNHAFLATQNAGSQQSPAGSVVAQFAGHEAYFNGAATAAMAPQSLLPDPGGSQPHNNLQPYLCITFIISLFGIYPTPT
jgi:microcystin-dependent protein